MINNGDRFGKLRSLSPAPFLNNSHSKVPWLCDCGRETEAIVKNVSRGNTSSCGRCNEISAEEMARRRFGKLRMKDVEPVKLGSGKKVAWICDCGRETIVAIRFVVSGNTLSCGRCGEISIEEVSERKFGKLRMKNPEPLRFGSNKEKIWICDCGREVRRSPKKVVSGHSSSCGRCNEIRTDTLRKMKFGKLRMKNPASILPGSNKKAVWICDCGRETFVTILSVTSGNTRSCGSCYSVAFSWWKNNKDTIRSLRCPINPRDIPVGFIALGTIRTTKSPFLAMCQACGREHLSKWESIRQGKSLTCGCSYNSSSLNLGMAALIRSSGLSVMTEFKVDSLKYDIFVPDRNLLIEMNGLKWHSLPGSKQRDLKKYRNALSSGYRFMAIFEDEWKNGRISAIINNVMGMIKPVTIRPSKCLVRLISGTEANKFHDEFHYIGKCNPIYSYGVFLDEKIVACASFGRPTRQTSIHSHELLRMASNPGYRVHGIWSQILKRFISEHRPSSIVSFSDNRLFSGTVYEKLGFKLDSELRPDYYWTDGYCRHHKSALRKKGAEKTSGLTESKIRENQGLSKIWDLGKKRWILECNLCGPKCQNLST